MYKKNVNPLNKVYKRNVLCKMKMCLPEILVTLHCLKSSLKGIRFGCVAPITGKSCRKQASVFKKKIRLLSPLRFLLQCTIVVYCNF